MVFLCSECQKQPKNMGFVPLNAIEGISVSKHDILGFMESTADHFQVIQLSKNVDVLQKAIASKNQESVSSYFLESFRIWAKCNSHIKHLFRVLFCLSNIFRQAIICERKG